MTDWILTPEEQMAGTTLGPAPQRALRPVLVGETNPYGADPYYALYPDPPNSAGGRLCRVVLRMEVDDYLAKFERVNLCPRQWSIKVARANAMELAASGKALVLLGSKVCAAFGMAFQPFVAGRLIARFQDGRIGERVVEFSGVISPHPSGLCRLWAQKDSYERTRSLVLGALTTPGAAA